RPSSPRMRSAGEPEGGPPVTATSLIPSFPRDAVAPRGPVLAVSQPPASSVGEERRPPVPRALGAHALLAAVAGVAAGRQRAGALRRAALGLALLASAA